MAKTREKSGGSADRGVNRICCEIAREKAGRRKVAVVVAAVKDMAAIAFHVMMETGVMVEALPLWADDLEHPGTFHNPRLLEHIRREGVRL